MQSQEQRDDKTVTIATALCLFIAVVGVGAIIGWAIEVTFHPDHGFGDALGAAVWCAAGVIPVAYLVRSVRR